ncbi:response regulator transcription factor [Cloacibacillus sp. An23]|uniref:response regulator transcription factor n=1 Tax=Cloacibacillus sp. An23 TaxID=1965591 RepID=UPI000B39F2A1|nr:response regulator transcription factor [Cloacibacillus sp. An23]OUO95068.1 DNA-binding response regulator [Cloacibacillus sp. An23]
MIRIFLADDHELFREGLKSLLLKEPDLEVAGSAADGAEAVKAVAELRPDIVLMDVTMPGMNGITAAEKICGEIPGVSVIVISMHNDRRFIAESLKAGARGYVLKECSPDVMLEAIHTVSRGDVYLSPKACTVLVEDYLRLLDGENSDGANPLSEREREVLALLVKGRTAKQTADILGISKNTVDTHRRRIMDKLGCDSMAELTRYAIREGFLTLE